MCVCMIGGFDIFVCVCQADLVCVRVSGWPSMCACVVSDLPVTLPMAASACSSCSAAVLLANVSGRDVPRAMMVMPATLGLRLITQPSRFPNCQHMTLHSMYHPQHEWPLIAWIWCQAKQNQHWIEIMTRVKLNKTNILNVCKFKSLKQTFV